MLGGFRITMDAGLVDFLQQNAPGFNERLGSDRWYLVAVSVSREKLKDIDIRKPLVLTEAIVNS